MTTVIPNRNRAVPMNRAKPSANLPKASRSTLMEGMVDRLRRPGMFSRSASRAALAMCDHSRVRRVRRHRIELGATPVIGQHVIKYVIDRDRADQPMISIDHRSVHQVVRREVTADFMHVRLVGEGLQLGVDQARRRVSRGAREAAAGNAPRRRNVRSEYPVVTGRRRPCRPGRVSAPRL